ncbi:MAG: S41 family peptidase [Prevotella sp.]
MKKLILTVCTLGWLTSVTAQDLSKVKVLDDSLFLNNKTYVEGNKYQRDAMIFVDMIADTHPYYIKKERRDSLFNTQQELLDACRECTSDSIFVGLLIKTLGRLHDKHTDVIDLGRLRARKQAANTEKRQPEQDTSTGIMANKGDLFHYTILPDESLCYLQFNQCADARTTRNDSLPRWDKTLDEMFSRMKAEAIRTLVVDAQYNNGGSSMLCDELLVHLRPFSEIRNISTQLRFSRLMAAYNPRVGVAKKAWEEAGHIDELYPMPAGKTRPGFVQPDTFDGKVFFIQGKKTFSSAGMLMTLARDNGIGIILGEKSTYSPSHYGEVMPYRLPNTNVVGTVSSKFFARPDKQHVGDPYLMPDITVSLDDKAEAWQKILQIVRE